MKRKNIFSDQTTLKNILENTMTSSADRMLLEVCKLCLVRWLQLEVLIGIFISSVSDQVDR